MIPIYVKTCYSFLSSIITIDDLILYAKKQKAKYVVICDDNMYGVMELITKAQENNLMPIIGLDVGISLLYAKNYLGYQNLLHLESIKSEREITFDDLTKYCDNLLCLVSEDYPELAKMKKIYHNIYVYGKDFYPTLCLNEDDLEIVEYLHLLRDNKTLSDDYKISNKYIYHDNNAFLGESFFKEFNFILPSYDLNLPNYCQYNDTKGLKSDDYLENLAIIGLNKRFHGAVSESYKKRLLYELSIIKKMGFSNYFLIVYDYIKYAKSHDILVGPGRGSAAGSLVSFSLGITEVDPLKYDLLFERFLNHERISMPDIDTDFPFDKRDRVIDYCIEKYGAKHVSLITTFGTFGSKMALRDMGRVMNIPLYIIDDLCKKVGDMPIKDLAKYDDIMNIINSDIKLEKLYKVASRIEGLPRHTSIHAAGVIISGTPLDEIVPLVYDNHRYLSGYEAGYLEKLGLLKMDFLGIKNLTIISETLKLIEKHEGKLLKFNDLPLQDEKTNQLFCNGDTSGVFQFESLGMREFLKKLQPSCFEDIYNANAFYRPGPSNSIDLYLKRRFGKEKVDYFDPRLESILKSTKGIMVYQEQIMQIASVMAGFTLGEADILRRAMSKKKANVLEKMKEKFISGAIKNNYSLELSEKIYRLILNFASYGFNKSHSVAYSMISYKMAYLKVNYPSYFYLSLLNSSFSDEKKTIMYLKEMKKYHIEFYKPDINESTDYYTILNGKVMLPLTIIKGISSVNAKKIMEIKKGGFTDIYDFFIKAVGLIPKNVLEALIYSGCLDNFAYNRRTLIENMDNLNNYGMLIHDLGKESVLKPEIIEFEEYSKKELIAMEKASFGFYLTNHPVTFYKNKQKDTIDLSLLSKYFNQNILTIVMVDMIKEINTKKGEKMAFLNCSDEEESVDIVVFPKVYQNLPKLEKNDIILVEGRVEKKNSDYHIIANKITVEKESI